MISQTKQCQNCKQSFVIEPEDFDFYEKIKVPPPTFCPDCRLQRRLSFRNERHLYKRKSSKSGKDIISIYSPDKGFIAYELREWNADDWDPMNYGNEYDFRAPFFGQLKELMRRVPHPALVNWEAVNSEYCNFTYGNKNCYLVFGGDFNESCLHSTFNFYSQDSAELYWVNKGELCYELIDSDGVYKSSFGRFVKSSNDVHFCFDMSGCQNCFGSTNLRNKNHYFFNRRCSADEYKKLVGEVNLGSYRVLEEIKARFRETSLQSIRRGRRLFNSPNSSGANIHNSRNCYRCFDVFDGAENCRYVFLASAGVKDSQSCDHIGLNSELCYDSISIYPGNRTRFSWIILNCHDIQYSISCRDCSSLFGCVGLKNKQYCILNKQYTKEQYEALIPKIVQHMYDAPYTDKVGRVYRYGEFFPSELSPFCYNETIAQEYFPLTKSEAGEMGYAWKDPEARTHTITKKSEDLPDNIGDVADAITEEVIGCLHGGRCNEQCTTAFRIIPQELQFYRKMNLPLPRLCPNCRHYQRLKQRNPLKLWHRKCQCAGAKSESNIYTNTVSHQHGINSCPNEFETSYSPERPEIVYCEQCYNAEVV